MPPNDRKSAPSPLLGDELGTMFALLRDNLTDMRAFASDRFSHLDVRLDKIEHDNRVSHQDTAEQLTALRALVGEHSDVLRGHEQRHRDAERRLDKVDGEIDDLASVTGQHAIIVAKREGREDGEAKVEQRWTDRSRFWFRTTIAVMALLITVAGIVAGLLLKH